jgi:hypothetical protein
MTGGKHGRGLTREGGGEDTHLGYVQLPCLRQDLAIRLQLPQTQHVTQLRDVHMRLGD